MLAHVSKQGILNSSLPGMNINLFRKLIDSWHFFLNKLFHLEAWWKVSIILKSKDLSPHEVTNYWC